jgi:hypothetical protein
MHPKIPDLLKDVQTLRLYEDKLAHVQGDRFNIFKLLNIGSLEAYTHTPYLAEFLDPEGDHGLCERPLAAFVELFKLDLDPTTTSVKHEYYLGPVTDNSGGIVDILLRDKAKHQVVIENKIYAADQPKQLHRYQNDPQLRGAQIVYLTLFGGEPSDESTLDKQSVLRRSYEKDVIRWQEACRCQAANAPLVRETITQYINLIKLLTNQSTNTHMSTQIIETVLKDQNSLAAYNELIQTQSAVHERIFSQLREQCRTIAASLGLEAKFNIDFSSKDGGVNFSDKKMRAQNFCIGFEFERANCRDLFFGIKYLEQEKKSLTPPEIAIKFIDEFGRTTQTDWWPAWSYWKDHRDWSNDGTFAAIAFGGRFQTELTEKVKSLLAIVQSVQTATALIHPQCET